MSGSRVLATATWNDIYKLTEAGRRELANQVGSYRWDDLRMPVTGINPPGQISDPDIDATDGNFLFDDSATELIYIKAQMPHAWKEGSELRPHIHWEQAASGNVLWQLDYKFFNNGDTIPALWTTIQSTDQVFTYASGTIAQISPLPSIHVTTMGISAILKMKLSRIGGDASDTMSGDASMTDFDIHFQSDDRGSEREYTKTNAA